MRASRAAIKTAKAVKTVEERLAAVEINQGMTQRQLTAIKKALQQLVVEVSAEAERPDTAVEERLTGIEQALQLLVGTATADKSSTAAEALGKPGAPKARTTRKRGGGA